MNNQWFSKVAVWLVIALVLFTVFKQFDRTSTAGNQIGYSEFLEEVRAKRIREVWVGPRTTGRLDYTDVRDLEWGGSLVRPEATGFGVTYFAEAQLKTKGQSFAGKTVVVKYGGHAMAAGPPLAAIQLGRERPEEGRTRLRNAAAEQQDQNPRRRNQQNAPRQRTRVLNPLCGR